MSLTNEDLSPTVPETRTWTLKHFAALWVGMAVCIPTYTLASGLIDQGMSWSQALLCVGLGNVLVLIPMVLNAHAGTKYGIPFPVFARASFGVLGANVPALLRAFVACGWFGIQTWFGGLAIYQLWFAIFPVLLPAVEPPPPAVLSAAATAGTAGMLTPPDLQLTMDTSKTAIAATPAVEPPPPPPPARVFGAPTPEMIKNARLPFLGATPGQLLAYFLFWLVCLYFIVKGTESIRWLETWAAPFLIAAGLALLAWAWTRAGGFGSMLDQPSKLTEPGSFMRVFAPGLTAMVGFWATLSLNIPDFTRYARSQRDQVLGQALGLPATMILFCFIGVAVTSATPVIFATTVVDPVTGIATVVPGETIWDPVTLIGRVGGPVVTLFAMFALSVATLSTNIAANVVSPANDFSNLAPGRISFKMGGIITAVVGTMILPWKLLETSQGYIFTWLVGYSALLGPVGGIMIADYFLLRRRELVLDDLYRRGGAYEYQRGFNRIAVYALLIGVAVCVPGFFFEALPAWKGALTTDAALLKDGFALSGPRLFLDPATSPLVPRFMQLYTYAWFVGFLLSGGIYWAWSSLASRPASVPSPIPRAG